MIMIPCLTSAGVPGLTAEAHGLTFAVGDIHGRLDLLDTALALIAEHADLRQRPEYRVVFLGDYIDRGPDSAAVVARLRDGADHSSVDWVCLKGNHEDLAVCPEGRERWLRNGGDMTLASYEGQEGVLELDKAWMADLPVFLDDGERLFVHAGVDPRRALDEQEAPVLTWIRNRFLEARRFKADRHVVHGHTPVWKGKPDLDEVERLAHRTNLDTGAYYTGVLAIGVFEAGRAEASAVLYARGPMGGGEPPGQAEAADKTPASA